MSILDEFPFPFQKEKARDLLNCMANLFNDTQEAKRFAQQFGADPNAIPPNLAAIDLWEKIILQLSNKGSIRRMVSEVRIEFSGNANVAALLDELLTPSDSSKPLKKAFIIQPIGDEAIRLRNDRLFEDLIRPACLAAGFEAERADKYPNKSITEAITSPVFGHPMVVADLGNLSISNPNALIEVGFRLATGRPFLCLSDKPLPTEIPSHLPPRSKILEVDPVNPKASLGELVSRIRTCFTQDKEEGKEQGWVSEHPWVDWRLALKDGEISEYQYANDKAASLYGLANVEEIIGHPVDDVDNRLYALMDNDYKKLFLEEQDEIIGRIIRRRVSLNTAASWPLIFSRHPSSNLHNEIYLPVIANYKYDKADESFVFRTVFLRIGEWAAEDFADRRVENRRIPTLFRKIYEHDFFLCFDTADFQQAEILKDKLTAVGFKVWWPQQHNAAKDEKLSAVSLKTELAKSRIAAVLVGSRDRGRWGQPELDEALRAHCEKKSLVLFLLPGASELEPKLNTWLGKRYEEVLPEPLYVKWPDVIGLLSGDTSSQAFGLISRDQTLKPLGRVLREVVKLLHLPGC
jgi:hypothetical protein